ncbi:MAG: serine/threonine-protein kinase [Kofleriaceae bacterium]
MPVDDTDSRDETLRQDAASAETALASVTPEPLPPPPSLGGGDGEATVRRYPPSSITRYVLRDELLGKGGMGEVMLAYDEQIGREVAVKRLRSDRKASQEELSRFVREALVQGRLEHPAVVPVHDLAYDGHGQPFFVMKRLAGTDLHELLKAKIADAATHRRRLLRAFADVCLAVEFAHSKGIIHRDLKPANIMLGEYGEVYILDWGVARTIGEADDTGGRDDPAVQQLALTTGDTRPGTVLGTPAYMSPEQLVGDKVGPAGDIYALGCILYEIVAGEPLHSRSRALGQAFQSIDAKPSSKCADSPPELDTICERAIRIEATARFGSARAMGDAVQAYLDGDRDVAVRRELAAHHLIEARSALARGSGEADRRAAMQAAGRALALDPTASEAADLVTRLMLEPPAEVPAEVEDQLAAIDTETARTQARLAAVSVMGYLAFVPLLVWSGVNNVAFVVAFALIAIASAVQVSLLTRRTRITAAPIYLNAAINAVLIGIVCRMVGPFIIAPTLVVTTLMAYASHPRFGKISVLATILSAAVVVPWVLELAGVLEPTYRFTDDGAMVLTSTVVRFSSVPVQLAFALLLVSLVGVVALLSRTLAVRQRDATRKLELQAWHLRQILPSPGR